MARNQPARVRRNVTVELRWRGLTRRITERTVSWQAHCAASHGRGRKRQWTEDHTTHNGAHMAKARHNREMHAS